MDVQLHLCKEEGFEAFEARAAPYTLYELLARTRNLERRLMTAAAISDSELEIVCIEVMLVAGIKYPTTAHKDAAKNMVKGFVACFNRLPYARRIKVFRSAIERCNASPGNSLNLKLTRLLAPTLGLELPQLRVSTTTSPIPPPPSPPVRLARKPAHEAEMLKLLNRYLTL